MHPCHLALAVLDADHHDFSRPDKPANLQARLKLYLSDLLEKAGQSLDGFRRVLWRNAVRLPIQEGYDCDEIHHRCVNLYATISLRPSITVHSADLLNFMRNSCLKHQYHHRIDGLYLHYLLKALIKHESLSAVMQDFPLTATEIVDMFDRLDDHASAAATEVNCDWAEDLTAAEEIHQSPAIGRVCLVY